MHSNDFHYEKGDVVVVATSGVVQFFKSVDGKRKWKQIDSRTNKPVGTYDDWSPGDCEGSMSHSCTVCMNLGVLDDVMGFCKDKKRYQDMEHEIREATKSRGEMRVRGYRFGIG